MSASGSNTTPSHINSPPAERADYRLLGLLGQGQFAQVYCAVHRRTGRLAAIKETRHARQQASQEPFILPALDHPNIIGCQEVIKTRAGYRLILDYCEAGTLRSHLNHQQNTRSALSLNETQALMSDLLQGLTHLHERGIAHGDLKPENLFLTWQHPSASYRSRHSTQSKLTLKIGDFGNAIFLNQPPHSHPQAPPTPQTAADIAADSVPNPLPIEIGSPTYAAPERFNAPPSIAADLYAVGVMIYELLLGDRPFAGPPAALSQAHKTSTPPLPNHLSPALKQLLSKALHKQPEQRFTSAADLQTALLEISTLSIEPKTQQNTEHKTQPATALSLPSDIPEASLSQCMRAIPSHGITAPIESLIHVPQGCCIVTAKSLHLLTPTHQLLSIARFKQDCWITVSPNGKWFVAVSKKDNNIYRNNNHNPNTRYQFSQGMVGRLSHRSGHEWRRAITLKGRLLTEACANVIQLIALNHRYLLRVSTTPSKTFFECFTRRGQFIGQLSLNFRLTQVVRTSRPYQLAAIQAPKPKPLGRSTAEDQQHSDSVVFITLKPFQVHRLSLPVVAEHISTLPWGYLVSYQRSALLLDRSAHMTSLLTGLPAASRIATIHKRTLLLTNSTLPSTVSPPTRQSPIAYKSSEPLSLLVADTSSLDLGLIF